MGSLFYSVISVIPLKTFSTRKISMGAALALTPLAHNTRTSTIYNRLIDTAWQRLGVHEARVVSVDAATAVPDGELLLRLHVARRLVKHVAALLNGDEILLSTMPSGTNKHHPVGVLFVRQVQIVKWPTVLHEDAQLKALVDDAVVVVHDDVVIVGPLIVVGWQEADDGRLHRPKACIARHKRASKRSRLPSPTLRPAAVVQVGRANFQLVWACQMRSRGNCTIVDAVSIAGWRRAR